MKSARPVKRKKRGRPATGQDPVSAIRLSTELTKLIDRWAVRNKAASRSHAIRRLVELGLAGSRPVKQTNPKAAAKASDMASRQIDKLSNPAMPDDERRARKRRLIKGPSEFRDMRGDQAKPK
jgi:hypothetical protein